MSHFDECQHGDPDAETVTPAIVTSFLAIHVEAQIDDLFESDRFLAMDKNDQVDALAIGAVLGCVMAIYRRTKPSTGLRDGLEIFFKSAVDKALVIAIDEDDVPKELKH